MKFTQKDVKLFMKKINLKINKFNYKKKKKSRGHSQQPDQMEDDNDLDQIEDLINDHELKCISEMEIKFNPKNTVQFISVTKQSRFIDNNFSQNLNLYGPPYTPQFNNIEQCFTLWKNYVSKLPHDNKEEILVSIYQAVKQLQKSQFLGFQVKSYKEMLKSLNFEDL